MTGISLKFPHPVEVPRISHRFRTIRPHESDTTKVHTFHSLALTLFLPSRLDLLCAVHSPFQPGFGWFNSRKGFDSRSPLNHLLLLPLRIKVNSRRAI